MLIIPAIDLYQGNVVRLIKGDPAQSKVYSNNPLEMAKKWEDEGAKLLHVVDLSAALGQGDNFEIIKTFLRELKVKIEIGGGIRSLEKAKELVDLGAQRVIIGTKGLDEDFLNRLTKEIDSEKIAVGVDVIDSLMAVEGWKKKTDFSGLDFIAYLQLKMIKWIIYTDISRDGTLEGLDCKETKKLKLFEGMNIILAGGVASLDDLKLVEKNFPFIWGVIVGKALYEGRIKLSEAKGYLNIDNI